MNKLVSFSKTVLCVYVVAFAGLSLSAYEIKHGYSAENGMTYYGICENGKDLVVLETEEGQFVYEGPVSTGVLESDGTLDKAARAACGE